MGSLSTGRLARRRWSAARPLSTAVSFSAGPMVRIQFPPAVSRQTIGSSAAEPASAVSGLGSAAASCAAVVQYPERRCQPASSSGSARPHYARHLWKWPAIRFPEYDPKAARSLLSCGRIASEGTQGFEPGVESKARQAGAPYHVRGALERPRRQLTSMSTSSEPGTLRFDVRVPSS
jgi:hypothetical protein